MIDEREEHIMDMYMAADYSTTPLNAEICTELKEEAESILQKLDIPVFAAIQMYYEQIIMLGRLPVDPNLPIKEPLGLHGLTPEELDAALQHSIETAKSGKRYSSKEVRTLFERSHDL